MVPRDVGLQTEMGRTSKGGLSHPPRRVSNPDSGREEEAPTFRILPQAGGQPYGEVGGFCFTLLFFFASTSWRAQISPRVGFAIRGSETEGEEDTETRGFMMERGEDLKKGSQVGLAPSGSGISDLMSSE